MDVYETFLNKLPNPDLLKVCNTLYEELMVFPQLKMLRKFNLPFFYGKTWICYFNLVKKNQIELYFVRARELPSKELLDFKGRSMVAGLSYKVVDDIDLGILKLLLEEAITLDNQLLFSSVKRKDK